MLGLLFLCQVSLVAVSGLLFLCQVSLVSVSGLLFLCQVYECYVGLSGGSGGRR